MRMHLVNIVHELAGLHMPEARLGSLQVHVLYVNLVLGTRD